MTQIPELKPPKILTWLAFIAVLNALLLLGLLLPVEPAIGIAAAALIGAILFAAWRGKLNLRFALSTTLRSGKRLIFGSAAIEQTEAAAQSSARWWHMLEIALLIGAAVWVTGAGRYIDEPIRKLRGWEAEWLTSSVYLAADSLREFGYIPKWQPYLEFGDPLITSPFAFVANPLSAGPSLLFGGLEGILISVTLYTALAGMGGWFLGWVLGCGGLGRVLLGLLLIGKGNMHAMIATGYFQLGVTQAYFPWITGGTLALLWLPGKRWPVVLTALACALMFSAGNIWYTLPMLLTMLLLAALYAWIIPGRAQWALLRRLALAGVLAAGISAVTLLPIWGYRDYIGDHPNEIEAGAVVQMDGLLPLFFNGDGARRLEIDAYILGYHTPKVEEVAQFYYTFAVPGWFFLLIFLVPPVYPWLHRPGRAGTKGLWLAGGIMIVLTIIWGAGGSPLFVWLYKNVPLIGQWRFVGRALAVASFWIAVLVALRVDGLWRALLHPGRWRLLRPVQSVALALLLVASGAAAYQLNANWGASSFTDPPTYKDDVCVSWLRMQQPGRALSVWRGGYDAVTTFLSNKVRLFNIEADYAALPIPWTLGRMNLLSNISLPEYGIAWTAQERAFFIEQGYRPVPGSALIDRHHCLWRKPDALSYAYTLPLDTAQNLQGESLDVTLTTPITTFNRLPDEIGLWAQADAQAARVLTLQEAAFPGWQVEVNGQPASLESVGGQIGVVLPAGESAYAVRFVYRPPLFYIGAALTLLTCAFCALYLLRTERCMLKNL